MRSDNNLQERFASEGVDASGYGSMPGVLDTSTEVEGQRVLRSHSFSGKEANSVFYNRRGNSFNDISGISGLDSIADGRAFAYLDYDRDGRIDIALTNTNNPQLQLFRNEMTRAGNSIQVRLVGGNRGAATSQQWSNRDGFGAHVLVEAGELRLRRELRCGDGFAAQNSSVLTIGIGSSSYASRVDVEWPSGKRSRIANVPAGSLITVHENPDEGAGTPSIVKLPPNQPPGVRIPVESSLSVLDLGLPRDRPSLSLVVCMATWCPVCREEIPHLNYLAEGTGGAIGFFGFPVDSEDSPAQLLEYRSRLTPPYQIIEGVTDTHRTKLAAHLKANFGEAPLPCSLVVDRRGRVVATYKGVPTLSDLRSTTP